MPAVGTAALNRSVCVMSQFGELTAVAPAFEAESGAVEPRIRFQRRVHSSENVLRLASVLIVEDRVREFLAVAGRSAEVHHQRCPAVRGVHLRLALNAGPCCPCGPPWIITISGCFAAEPRSSPAGFVRYASIDVPSKLRNVNASVGAERPVGEERRVQRRQRLAGASARFDEELGEAPSDVDNA